MIYTVTLNPSIDYIVNVKDFQVGELNKVDHDEKYPGGKGINVSRILTELGFPTTALGYIGGFTGNFIDNWLKEDHVQTNFISIADDNRINVKLKSSTETEINGKGPVITENEATKLLSQLEQVSEKDIIIFSGSKPPSLPSDFYEQMIEKVTSNNIEFIIDTTGKDLETALPLRPFLVKPNLQELSELFQVELQSTEDVIPYGLKLLEMGAKNAIVSLGGDGALLFTSKGVFHGKSPKGIVKNSVGAGDSMIAGFIGQYTATNDYIQAFRMGIASGSATAFSSDLAKKEDINHLLDQVEINEIEKG